MCQAIEKYQENSNQRLHEELELRYGPAVAQGVIDEINRAENPAYVPGYMAVKALSETVETFRPEARTMLKKLADLRKHQGSAVEEAQLRQEFERVFEFYWRAQHGFYSLYRQAMHACKAAERQSRSFIQLATLKEQKQAA